MEDVDCLRIDDLDAGDTPREPGLLRDPPMGLKGERDRGDDPAVGSKLLVDETDCECCRTNVAGRPKGSDLLRPRDPIFLLVT